MVHFPLTEEGNTGDYRNTTGPLIFFAAQWSVSPIVKAVGILFCCILSYTSAISVILHIITGEFETYTAYNPQDGELDICGSDQASSVCARPSCIPAGVGLLCVLQYGSIV